MAYMGACQSHGAAPAQPQHADPLRDGRFNTGAPRRFAGILHRLLPLAPRLEREIVVLGASGDRLALLAFARANASATTGAGLAILLRELDRTDEIARRARRGVRPKRQADVL